ncbi:hypothetical protein I549_5761 [Mycobacterium avium subsp. avium 2285 (R)]|nr:hypothetical protein I549_5761 [Mycobacterium avium subsp. avium 2285 (R)]
MVVRREDHRALRQADIAAYGVTAPILGGAVSSGWVQGNGACLSRHH